MPCHIIHFAVTAGIEPRAKPRLVGGKFGIGDAELGETELVAPEHDIARKLREVHRGIVAALGSAL